MEFRFKQPQNLAVFTCTHVINDRLPILVVLHETDGNWQFLCNKSHSQSDAKIVGLAEIVKLDPSLNELANIKPGTTYQRDSVKAKFKQK